MADCPYYLSIGMTFDQYWYGDTWMVRAFREADRLRRQRKNMDAWLQGMYIYDAVARLAPILHAFAKKGTKALPYPAEPYPFEGEKKSQAEQEKQEEQEALRAKLYMNNMVRAGKNWGK